MSEVEMSVSSLFSLFNKAKLEFARRRAAATKAVGLVDYCQELSIGSWEVDQKLRLCGMSTRMVPEPKTPEWIWTTRRAIAWSQGFLFPGKTLS